MIRVLHVTEDHSAANTGITFALDALTRCVPENIQPAIACVGADTVPLRPGVDLHIFPTHGVASLWRYSPGAAQELGRVIAGVDVVHLHGLWMWPQWSAARQAARLRKPFVITSHGMLQPWMWQRQSWPHRLKKYLYWNAFAYPAFRRANVIHALTPREATILQNYFPNQTIEVIPHGIDLEAADREMAELPLDDAGDPPYFLFVGRLHPGKGVDLLIRAFARLPERNFLLKIAGPTQQRERTYAEMVHKLVENLGLEDRVIFTGEVKGRDKWALYRNAWSFCLPSFSEVIGLVNLEAAAARIPVITTYETGIVDEWNRCGGILIHSNEEAIYQALSLAQSWSQGERQERGKAMRALVEKQFSWRRVGQQWAEIYQRLAGNLAEV